MPKKLILSREEVEKAYQETGNLHKAAKILGISRLTLMNYMDKHGITRKTNGDFHLGKDELQTVYDELKSTRLISERYGVCRSIIKRLCRLHDIQLEAKQPSSRLLPEIAKLTEEGKDNSEIASILNLSVGYINELARENNIAIKHSDFHKGHIITHNGYKMLRIVDHPDADSKGYVREHRKVIAEKLNMPALPKDMVCHHIDGNKLNNDPDNLEIMTLSEHSRLHRHQH